MIKKLMFKVFCSLNKEFEKSFNETKQAKEELLKRPFGTTVPLLGTDSYNGIPIQIIYDALYVRAFGYARYALAVKEASRYFIAVDDLFMGLSDKTKEAMILHELGHIKLDHLDNMKSSKTAAFKRVFLSYLSSSSNVEFDADVYAINHIGKDDMINALREIILHADENTNIKEIENRIEKISRS